MPNAGAASVAAAGCGVRPSARTRARQPRPVAVRLSLPSVRLSRPRLMSGRVAPSGRGGPGGLPKHVDQAGRDPGHVRPRGRRLEGLRHVVLALKKRSEKSVCLTSSTCHAFHGSASFMHRVPSVTSNLCVSGDSACPCPSSDRLVQDSNAASASSMRGLQPARNRTLCMVCGWLEIRLWLLRNSPLLVSSSSSFCLSLLIALVRFATVGSRVPNSFFVAASVHLRERKANRYWRKPQTAIWYASTQPKDGAGGAKGLAGGARRSAREPDQQGADLAPVWRPTCARSSPDRGGPDLAPARGELALTN